MDMESSSSSRSATPAGSHEVPATNDVRPCVAYIMSRFPKLTETFVLDEILELERRGIRVEVFPLWREPAKVIHQDARPIVERAHFTPTIDLQILGDNLLQLTRTPVLFPSVFSSPG